MEAEPVTPNGRMDGWLVLVSHPGGCVFRELCIWGCRNYGDETEAWADSKEGLHGAGGTGKWFEPGAGKAFRVRK